MIKYTKTRLAYKTSTHRSPYRGVNMNSGDLKYGRKISKEIKEIEPNYLYLLRYVVF